MVNQDSIMKKVVAYSKSPEGKATMQAVIDDARKNKTVIEGMRLQTGNGLLTNDDDMIYLTDVMIHIIQKHLPDSIKETGQGLHRTEIMWRYDKNYRKLAVYFDEKDLFRPSLMWEDSGDGAEWTESRPWQSNYPNGGIDNIVALLNNGVHASDYVYGRWHGHASRNKKPGDRSWPDSVYIRSRKDREPLRFMQEAVSEFNRKFGKKYNVIAYCSTDYGPGDTSGLLMDSVLLQS